MGERMEGGQRKTCPRGGATTEASKQGDITTENVKKKKNLIRELG